MTTDHDGHTTIRLTTATIAAIIAALGGLGAGFLTFYNAICVPQVAYLQDTRDRLSEGLDKLGDVVESNTKAVTLLRDELKREYDLERKNNK